MKTLDDLFTLSPLPKTALVRVDYNITLSENVSESELYRIVSSRDTIRDLLDHGIVPVVVSHYGRAGSSIAEIIPYIEHIVAPVLYVSEWDVNTIHSQIESCPKGSIVLLPNSRTHSGEESCSSEFIQLLSSIADVYVNDAFSASHRSHATITGVSRNSPSYAGRQIAREIVSLAQARNTSAGSLVIIGGAKFDTKMNLIQYYLDNGADVCVVGALAHPLYKSMGFPIGASFCDDSVDVSLFVAHPHLWVAHSVVVSDGEVTRSCHISEVCESEQILDMGIDSVMRIKEKIADKNTVIWNGPLGVYEKGFIQGTVELVSILENSTAFRVVGGGDLLACIPYEKYSAVADFCSTGGGAMLEYLYKGSLPGIDSLN
jgi:phosphoglycerate kinase